VCGPITVNIDYAVLILHWSTCTSVVLFIY